MYNKKLRKIRHLLYLTCTDVAKGTKYARQNIYNIEGGCNATDANCNYYRLWLIHYMEEHWDDLKNDDYVDYKKNLKRFKGREAGVKSGFFFFRIIFSFLNRKEVLI